MKKIVIAIFIMILFLSGFKAESKFSLLDYFQGEYLCYSTEKMSDTSTDLGFCYMSDIPQSSSLIGESMVLHNFEVGDAIKTLNARVIKTEMLDDNTTVIYAYTNKIDTSVSLENQRVNLQFALKSDYVVIGWPLIIGSY